MIAIYLVVPVSAIVSYAWAMDGFPAVIDSHYIGTLNHNGAVHPVRPVEIVDMDHPVDVNHPAAVAVNDDARMVVIPGIRGPGTPPGGVILPAIGGNVHRIVRPKNILDSRPVVDVYVVSSDIIL